MSNLGQLRTDKTPEDTRRDIDDAFRKWGIDEYRIPRNGKGTWGEAVITFYVNDSKQELRCDRFPDYRDNLRALYLILDALRKAQERGILQELARAAVAFLPPAPDQPRKRPWYEVLQVTPKTAAEVVKASYRALSMTAHPDKGGSEGAMAELNEAYEQFKRERGL